MLSRAVSARRFAGGVLRDAHRAGTARLGPTPRGRYFPAMAASDFS
jgi:hypothetical protein